jgi:hypothetical protein
VAFLRIARTKGRTSIEQNQLPIERMRRRASGGANRLKMNKLEDILSTLRQAFGIPKPV